MKLFRARILFGIMSASLAFTACSDTESDEPPVGGDECVEDDPREECQEEVPVDDSRCGNGIVEFFEECDDGNEDPLDGCHECRFWEPASGEPLELADPGDWSWHDIAGAICRDGSDAGLSVNVGADPNKVLFFFEGGGACFDVFNCMANPSNISSNRRSPGPHGIFDRNNDRNPYKEWTYVYLPYCSGDVFAGNSTEVVLNGLNLPQQYVGDNNMSLFLDRLVPSLPDAVEHVSVLGVSAGGISAVVNTKRLAREFPDARVTLLDDGGPPLTSNVVTNCLQSWWNELWNLETTVLADCGSACKTSDDLLFPVAKDIATYNERVNFGLFSYKEDKVVRLLFTFGLDNCAMMPFPLMTAQMHADGLDEFRELMSAASPRFATYYAPGDAHTCIHGGCFYDTEVDGVGLPEWTAKLLNFEHTHVGE